MSSVIRGAFRRVKAHGVRGMVKEYGARKLADHVVYFLTVVLIYYPLSWPAHLLPESSLTRRIRVFVVESTKTAPQLPRRLFINRGDTAVIVGTPYKHSVKEARRCVGENGTVLVIEPDPRNIDNLRPVVEEHSNVLLDERGAWSEGGEQTMTITSHGHHNFVHTDEYRHLAHDAHENQMEEITISVETVDTICSDHGIEADYLEVMVNGAELEILSGGVETLSDASPRVLAKGHAEKSDEEGRLNEDIADLLESEGYGTVLTGGTRYRSGRDGDVFGWS